MLVLNNKLYIVKNILGMVIFDSSSYGVKIMLIYHFSFFLWKIISLQSSIIFCVWKYLNDIVLSWSINDRKRQYYCYNAIHKIDKKQENIPWSLKIYPIIMFRGCVLLLALNVFDLLIFYNSICQYQYVIFREGYCTLSIFIDVK